MKKMILCLTAILSSISLTASAEAEITVNDVYVKAGSTAYFTLNLKGGRSGVYESVDVNFTLPEGFSFTEDENHKSSWEGSTIMTGTSIGLMNATSKLVSGDFDNLMSLQFAVEDDVKNGTYQITLDGFDLGYNGNQHDYPAAVTFNVIVTDVLTLDENSQVAPETTTTNSDVKVVRTLNAGEWSTICLPFALNAANIAEIFPDGCEIAELAGYDVEKDDAENIVGINVNFNPSTVIRANQPYIIKVNANVKEFTAKSKKVSSKPVATELENDDLDIYATMTGTNVARTVVPKNSLFLSDNKFYYSAGKTKIKAFRAYFTFMDILSSLDGASTRVKYFVTDGDETTQIQIPELLNDGEYYNLNGVRVETPSKGIYIKDGKKVVVK